MNVRGNFNLLNYVTAMRRFLFYVGWILRCAHVRLKQGRLGRSVCTGRVTVLPLQAEMEFTIVRQAL